MRSKYGLSFIKSIFWSALLFLLAFVGGRQTLPKTTISPLAAEPALPNVFSLWQKPKELTEILPDIRRLINEQKGSFSYYLVDINSGKSAGINETAIFTAASVNKLPILAALYTEAENGQLDLDERITVQARDIQDYGTGIIRSEGPGGVYSLKTLARLMIEKSDNTAAYILMQKITSERIQELVEKWGLTQTVIADNKTSNLDMANLLIKMYQGQITDKPHTLEMVGFLDDSDFENRLPAGLPDNIKVYHKIGTEIANLHDVGIVDLDKHPYYIGVFTNDIGDEIKTETAIAEISRLTYEFMLKI